MSLIKYEILLTAVEQGSITAAAEIMGYTQSGVSHMLNSLEEELGLKLITRSKSGVQLTSAGELLLPHIKRVVDDNNNFFQAVSEMTGLLKGKLVIGSFATISSYYLPSIIEEFQKSYPLIDFELKIGTYQEIERMIRHREVDCGFISGDTEEKFCLHPVIRDRYVAVTAKGYPHQFTNTSAIQIDELIRENLIVIESTADHDVMRVFSNTDASPKYKIVTNDAFSTVEMVKRNLGIGLLPVLLANEFSDVLDIFELEVSTNRTLSFAYSDKKFASPITKKFIKFIETKEPIVYDRYE